MSSNKHREKLTFSDLCIDFVRHTIDIDENLHQIIMINYQDNFEKALGFCQKTLQNYAENFDFNYVED